ncbi:MAG: methylated-DNA--[protein]-cysteine S-methyltransferase [Candidatus Limimorpha sp.]
MFKYLYKSKIGNLEILVDEEFLYAIYFEDSNNTGLKFINSCKTICYKDNKPEILIETINYLDNYFNTGKVCQTPRTKTFGSEFQEKVWNILRSIPFGKTMTYSEISKEIEKDGRRSCAQAIGNAVSKNPIAIIIPCHRVIGSKGQLTGYAGGMERKAQLLEIEGFNIHFGRIIS